MLKSQTASRSHMRRPPTYWWDFKYHVDGSTTIAIETDDPRCEKGIVEETAPLPPGPADSIIDAVVIRIADFQSGRVDPLKERRHT